ncbi:hypothetical protein F4780DRAFT_488492 [Xylariomycetidae sp. FL0641]|nr:hypothetical protein F4780DRAFT_488492 [Xylariomycetidae sp. FL0641]
MVAKPRDSSIVMDSRILSLFSLLLSAHSFTVGTAHGSLAMAARSYGSWSSTPISHICHRTPLPRPFGARTGSVPHPCLGITLPTDLAPSKLWFCQMIRRNSAHQVGSDHSLPACLLACFLADEGTCAQPPTGDTGTP